MGYVFGDTSGDLEDHARAGNQTIELHENDSIVGDAAALLDHSRGGDDNLTRIFYTTGSVIGDALEMHDHAVGGNDTLVSFGGKVGAGYAFGDALDMGDHAAGGDDSLSVSGPYEAGAWGDAQHMTGHARGGDDVLAGSSGGAVSLYGDAETLSGHAQGGDDRLSALASAHSRLYGDGLELLDHAMGGNDTLVSGGGDDVMYGDAETVASGATTGADTFVFSPGNGKDQIMDFESGKDHIQLQGFGFTSFEDLASHFQDTDQGLQISFDATNSVLVAGIHHLSSSDFLLS